MIHSLSNSEPDSTFPPNKRQRKTTTVTIDLKPLDLPLFPSSTTNDAVSTHHSIILHSNHPYTIGRSTRHCDFVFSDRHVSKRHCQLLLDASLNKLYILNGVLLPQNDSAECVVYEFRKRVMLPFNRGSYGHGVAFRESSNGVFVNGVEIRKGMASEVSIGDKVSLVCGNEDGSCCAQDRKIGFVVQRIDFDFEMNDLTLSGHSQGKRNKRVFAVSRYERIFGRTNFLLDRCREILLSDDPISCVMRAVSEIETGRFCVDGEVQSKLPRRVKSSLIEDKRTGLVQSSSAILHQNKVMLLEPEYAVQGDFCGEGNVGDVCGNDVVVSNGMVQSCSTLFCENKDMALEAKCDKGVFCGEGNGVLHENPDLLLLDSVREDDLPFGRNKQEKQSGGDFYPSPGKNFYLNRLEFMDHGSSGLRPSISLPELLYPIESISRMFIASFTTDIKWFLTYCKIPFHLPVTIACHNTQRCWSSRLDDRVFVPYKDYPNLVVVYPPFPESIAFSNNRKRHGIACHHPKLIVVQRRDSIRVIITSANLVEKQWNSVTNTIWWQDFPNVTSADFASLFPKTDDGDFRKDPKCDFASQLAGFMASLIIDVPSQAHWIAQLTKYDFGGAEGHLVASVPGVHFNGTVMPESVQALPSLGSVVTSVVGLSHLFRSAADSNNGRLKALASFLGKSSTDSFGRLEITLRRNFNVPADENAVSILVHNPDGTSEGDYVQLGFLPRNVAKWVSPLWDAGFFMFSGFVCPKEALAVALGENCTKVLLILNVSKGQQFRDISKMMQSEHIVAFSSLIASIRRCYGLWRLQEVLNQYRWPESLSSDIIYGASSIGSINSKFLAAFSVAAGKKSMQHFDSEESDPEWGCWNAREELKNPSVRIIFPTIERVKSAYNGILPSRHVLCFSERTWQRLKTLDILHDAIPHPPDRIGHPMHTKVLQRRFWSRRDAHSFGWVYCGSHNFSAAAWGRQISNPFGTKADGPQKIDPSMNSGLHICNYELGIIFTFPPTENDCSKVKSTKLDDIILPFVVPAPKYGSRDRPATMQAMREVIAELAEREMEKLAEEELMEDLLEEEEEMESANYVGEEKEDEEIDATNYVGEEKEDEKAYAEMLWSQVDSSQSS
ncbi:hypothetical protein TanjilG_27472 [Lupinus angustifolius]|uniref:FHA domain-containing protein n=1 Tax=Lupinus angustifolius TaxID=3871 RepID=A0A4P1R362_LUPAN|nr:PREDICTED: uncharacterized protein LOC109362775 [Lupinus angustifolius]OIW00221.1 hypothetical protein TanjilG_27472 [Lupinus angustifolius]